ncbi:UDP-N-acetylmuramate dehydrogenase [bacterium]|nr:UDP-N-acetylmuramate dehydrogenase [bacterium]
MISSIETDNKCSFLFDYFADNPYEGLIQSKVNLARYTSFKTGGNAQVLCDIYTLKGLKTVVGFCFDNNIPIKILGFGTDVLVSDYGVDAVVIRLTGKDFSEISKIDDTQYKIGSRVSLQKIISITLKNQMSGVEWLCGIPGSLGGLISLNAGAFGYDISQILESVTVMSLDAGIETIPAEKLFFGYRKGFFENGEIIIEAVLKFSKSTYGRINKILTDVRSQRKDKFPHSRSAGCVFKNTQNIHSGELIDRMGFKNIAVGGAKVSAKHANFIVTSEGAESRHIFELIRLIKQKAKMEFNIILEPEIKIWGHENE